VTTSISLRVYAITLHPVNSSKSLPFDTDFVDVSPQAFLKNFVGGHTTVVRNDDEDRSWFFEEKVSDNSGSTKGYIHYGTYGFESDFVDNKTQKKKYRRQINDIEQIPLFYQFWFPGRSTTCGYAVFQSFQGRSCVQLVTSKAQKDFRDSNEGFALRFKKLLPTDQTGSLYSTAGVKRLRLIKRNAPGDKADKYIGPSKVESVDFELSINARPRQSLGPFGALFQSLKSRAGGVVVYDGIEFSEATADIRVGNRLRKISVFGGDTDAGVIDITDDVTRGPDGHPKFESVAKEAAEILKDFHTTLTGQ
jgi:hypothetical protein